MLENNISEIEKLSNIIRLNLEYESKFCAKHDLYYEDKLLKIKKLLSLVNVFFGNEENVKKYLVSK